MWLVISGYQIDTWRTCVIQRLKWTCYNAELTIYFSSLFQTFSCFRTLVSNVGWQGFADRSLIIYPVWQSYLNLTSVEVWQIQYDLSDHPSESNSLSSRFLVPICRWSLEQVQLKSRSCPKFPVSHYHLFWDAHFASLSNGKLEMFDCSALRFLSDIVISYLTFLVSTDR